MGDIKQKNVPVSVDFTGISDPVTQQWTVPDKTPVFTVEKKTKVKAGENTITWTVTATKYQSGFVPTLPSSGGVAFNPGSGWPNHQPTAVSALVYEVNDNFEAPPNDTDYQYTINVTLTSASDASVFKSFPYDPEVQNESTPVVTVTP